MSAQKSGWHGMARNWRGAARPGGLQNALSPRRCRKPRSRLPKSIEAGMTRNMCKMSTGVPSPCAPWWQLRHVWRARRQLVNRRRVCSSASCHQAALRRGRMALAAIGRAVLQARLGGVQRIVVLTSAASASLYASLSSCGQSPCK